MRNMSNPLVLPRAAREGDSGGTDTLTGALNGITHCLSDFEPFRLEIPPS